MALVLYNTMTRQKEPFAPLQSGTIAMYVCGPTVYDHGHVGHARKEVVFDVIVRYLRYVGYTVRYVRNITDVDDKIIQRAQQEQCSWKEVANTYEEQFHRDMDALNVIRPDYEPRATEHIADMQELIQLLLDKGYAYVSEGNVYFSVAMRSDYGKLSHRRMEEMLAGARIEVDERKQNPLDFALWKASKPGEPYWKSPWGNGRPGWHIECSAMSRVFLGDTLDIHGGGLDLVFPHHENEIAQSESATGTTFCRYWIHNGLLSVSREKMSKSLGNIVTIADALKHVHPEVLRFFFLSHHYRTPVDYSSAPLQEARKNMDYFYTTLLRITEISGDEEAEPSLESPRNRSDLEQEVYQLEDHFVRYMDDDFNTAGFLGQLFKTITGVNRWIDSSGQARTREGGMLLRLTRSTMKRIGAVLGILREDPVVWFRRSRDVDARLGTCVDDGMVEQMIRERDEARKAKNWDRADSIRKELAACGIIIEDTPHGTRWKRGC